MEPSRQREVLDELEGIDSFDEKLEQVDRFPLKSSSVDILQINVGKRCNLSCKHCHVEAGPDRTEVMTRETLQKCVGILENSSIGVVDVTGGAPEMNPNLDWFIGQVAPLGRRLIVRTNLTILLEEAYKRYIDVYTDNRVEIVASLPDYRQSRSDRQRGAETFDKSIRVLRMLNDRGYGKDGTGLILGLVHNPIGAYLPGTQTSLEHEYRVHLESEFGIRFNGLFSLNNCPVGRYLDYLIRSENLDDYMRDLANAFNVVAADQVMCRATVSVGWDGILYDCDFNQMLNLPINHGAPDHVDRFDLNKLAVREIMTRNHCYSCTAGCGSSCQGSLE